MDKVKKSVMQEIWELACLLLQFKKTATQYGLDECCMGTGDMFTRQHFVTLREAINTLEGDKHGLKLNLNAIIVRMIKSIKGMHEEQTDDVLCHKLDMFMDTNKLRLHEMFASARYKTVAQSIVIFILYSSPM